MSFIFFSDMKSQFECTFQTEKFETIVHIFWTQQKELEYVLNVLIWLIQNNYVAHMQFDWS
jgi:hypothetical protein